MKKENEGWSWLINSNVNHYFVGNETLCKRFMVFGVPEYGIVFRENDCKKCLKKFEKRKNSASPVKIGGSSASVAK